MQATFDTSPAPQPPASVQPQTASAASSSTAAAAAAASSKHPPNGVKDEAIARQPSPIIQSNTSQIPLQSPPPTSQQHQHFGSNGTQHQRPSPATAGTTSSPHRQQSHAPTTHASAPYYLPMPVQQLLSQLEPGRAYFNHSAQPFVTHSQLSLTGIDCIALSKTVEDMQRQELRRPATSAAVKQESSAGGHTSDASAADTKPLMERDEFRTLLQLLSFSVKFQQHQLNQERLKVARSAVIHPLRDATNQPPSTSSEPMTAPLMTTQLAQAIMTASAVPNTTRNILDRDLHGQLGLYTPQQFRQLQTQMVAAGYIANGRTIPDPIIQAVRYFDELTDAQYASTAVQHEASKASAAPPQHMHQLKPRLQAATNKVDALLRQQNEILASVTVQHQSTPPDAGEMLLESWCGKHQPSQIPYGILRYERDKLVDAGMSVRRQEVDQCIKQLQLQNQPIPYYLQREQSMFNLLQLQRRVRRRVVQSLPPDVCAANRYRLKKQVEYDQRVRQKKMKSAQQAKTREERKHRSEFTRAVLTHCREFYDYHLKHRMQVKRVSAAVVKEVETFAKRADDIAKRAERDRLQALRENNEEQYIALLKEAKNERLLHLLEETDRYMSQLGAHIQAEQVKANEHQTAAEMRRAMTADGSHGESLEELIGANGEIVTSKRDALIKLQRAAPALVVADQSHLEEATNTLKEAPKAAVIKQEAAKPVDKAEQEDGDHSVEYLVNARKRYYSMAHAIKEEIVSQPRCMKFGQLRDYQKDGLRWLVSLYNNHLNGILADEMGLGKTVQSLSLLAYLMEVKQNYGPFLIIAPMSTLHNNWVFELNRWLPDVKAIIYDGDKAKRKALRETQISSGDFNVLLTTFEFSMRDSMLRKIAWEYIIIDEAHRLKNPKCKLATELNKYSARARRVALTGTPLQNDLPELWALLNFLHPSIFNSSEAFDKWFATPFSTLANASTSGSDELRQAEQENTNMNEEEKLLVINRLHSILRPFMLRREKREVETDMPDKVEKIVRCSLTESQRILYQQILHGNVSIHNKMIQLRKVTNHPYLFHPHARGMAGSMTFDLDNDILKLCGKFQLLDQILPKLFITKHRVLIFNQMTKVMDILDRYLQWKQYKYLRLDGTTDADSRKESLKLFNEKDSDYFVFILSTKAGGLGLNLQTADTVILFDSDWNPQNDLQAQARVHRLGQTKQVLILRFVTNGTVEEKVLATASTKLNQEMMVIQAGMFHEQYQAERSREMVSKAISVTGKKQKKEAADEEEDGELDDEEAVSKIIARSELELELFTRLDEEHHRQRVFESYYQFPPGYVPAWLMDYCVRGQRAMNSEQRLVQYSDERLQKARNRIDQQTNSLDLKRHQGKAAGTDTDLDYLYNTNEQVPAAYLKEQQRWREQGHPLPITRQIEMFDEWNKQQSLPAEELAALEKAAERRHDRKEIQRDNLASQITTKHAKEEEEDDAEEEIQEVKATVNLTIANRIKLPLNTDSVGDSDAVPSAKSGHKRVKGAGSNGAPAAKRGKVATAAKKSKVVSESSGSDTDSDDDAQHTSVVKPPVHPSPAVKQPAGNRFKIPKKQSNGYR